MEGQGAPWLYSANKDDNSNLTCAAGDITCYFLPYHGCESTWNVSNWSSKLGDNAKVEILEGVEESTAGTDIHDDLGWSAYLFLTRKQLWLRRALFDYKEHFKQEKNIDTESDCSVIHVCHADTVHDPTFKPLFPVADYVNLIPEEQRNNPNHYIYLLTDDSNSILEAHEFFPDLEWKYTDKPRHNGSSGGWESHTPSRNPAFEVIIILAEFELTMGCSVLVHGPSGFPDFIYRHVSSKLFLVMVDEIDCFLNTNFPASGYCISSFFRCCPLTVT